MSFQTLYYERIKGKIRHSWQNKVECLWNSFTSFDKTIQYNICIIDGICRKLRKN